MNSFSDGMVIDDEWWRSESDIRVAVYSSRPRAPTILRMMEVDARDGRLYMMDDGWHDAAEEADTVADLGGEREAVDNYLWKKNSCRNFTIIKQQLKLRY
jgi:hypothetical protein